MGITVYHAGSGGQSSVTTRTLYLEFLQEISRYLKIGNTLGPRKPPSSEGRFPSWPGSPSQDMGND